MWVEITRFDNVDRVDAVCLILPVGYAFELGFGKFFNEFRFYFLFLCLFSNGLSIWNIVNYFIFDKYICCALFLLIEGYVHCSSTNMCVITAWTFQVCCGLYLLQRGSFVVCSFGLINRKDLFLAHLMRFSHQNRVKRGHLNLETWFC